MGLALSARKVLFRSSRSRARVAGVYSQSPRVVFICRESDLCVGAEKSTVLLPANGGRVLRFKTKIIRPASLRLSSVRVRMDARVFRTVWKSAPGAQK